MKTDSSAVNTLYLNQININQLAWRAEWEDKTKMSHSFNWRYLQRRAPKLIDFL